MKWIVYKYLKNADGKRQEYSTCEGVIPSIMMINCPLILSECVEPVVKLLSVVYSVVLYVQMRNVTSRTEEITEI